MAYESTEKVPKKQNKSLIVVTNTEYKAQIKEKLKIKLKVGNKAKELMIYRSHELMIKFSYFSIFKIFV